MNADTRPPGAIGTWDCDYPADLLHLPSGMRLSVCAYSNRAHRFTRFPAVEGTTLLGERTLDGSEVNLRVAHAGTLLELRYRANREGGVTGSWSTRETGEWGLRFWVLLCLRFDAAGPDERPFEWDREVLAGAGGGHRAALAGERAPLLLTFHRDLDALREEFDTRGYWYLESRDARGPLAACRYNLEEMPAFSFTLRVTRQAGDAGAEPCVPAARDRPAPLRPLHEGRFAGALDAIRDVVGWNTVYDPVNRRRYTALSRNWSSLKFGGFGVWLDDVLYHALLAALFDRSIAMDNLRAALAGATEAGNLPCLVTGRDAWVDRSQPPIGALVLWSIHLRWGDTDCLRECFPVLLANHEWWWRERDGNRNGLLEYGTSPVGRGLYRGTKLAAKDESMMDNSPVHDEAVLLERSWTLDCEDVALNSLLALDAEMLAHIAGALGDERTAGRLAARGARLKERIQNELWDPERAVFANRLWSGAFVRSIAPTSFFPLTAGAANSEQAAAMLRHFEDPAMFGGEWMLPSVARSDPAYTDNVYWRGRVWPPLNFLTYLGLRRYGREAAAAELAAKSHALFMKAWRAQRHCAENYNAETGEADDQADTDTFYTWGALLPLMAVAELAGVDPWNGFEVRGGGPDFRLGSLRSPLGETRVDSTGGVLSIDAGGRPLLRTDLDGRVRLSGHGNGRLELAAPVQRRDRYLEFPGLEPAQVSAEANGMDLEAAPAAGGVRFTIPGGGKPWSLHIHIRRPGPGGLEFT